MEPTRKFRPRDKMIFALGCLVLLISMIGQVGVVARGLLNCDDSESGVVEFEWDKDDRGHGPERFHQKGNHGPDKLLKKWGHAPENVKVSGAWNVEIIKGETFDVQVDGQEETRGYLDIDRRHNTLVLKSDMPPDRNRATVRVTMPELESLKAEGATRVIIRGFHQKEMEISASGASQIIAESGTVYDLELKTSGAAKVNFRRCPTKNADVKLTGATKLDLTMTGGCLEGKVIGASHITYYGDVSEIDIKSYGPSGVRKG